MSDEFKEGRLSNEDRKFIVDNYEILTVEEISKELRRSPDTIRKHIDEYLRGQQAAGEITKVVVNDIKLQAFFPELMEQYSKRELQVIEFHWNSLIQQFREDVLHTEKMQILQFGETMVDISRIKKREKAAEEHITKLEVRLAEFHEIPKDERQPNWEMKVSAIDRQLADLRNTSRPVTEEKNKLIKQANDLLTALKATRNQRVNVATDARMDFVSLLKVLADEKFRAGAVRHNHLMQLSAQLVRLKLYGDHHYIDGSYDKPILNSESVKDETLPGDYAI